MNEATYELEGIEAEVRNMYDVQRKRIDVDWSSAELAVLNATKADCYAARTRKSWGELITVLEGWTISDSRLKVAIRRLVGAGYLNSRRSYSRVGKKSVTVYEVNFA